MQNSAKILRFILVITITSIATLTGGCWRQTVLCIDSYHPGYPPSDDVMEGIRQTLHTHDLHLRVFSMDTARYSDPNFIKQSTDRAISEIRQYKPAVIIASGDNAAQYVLAPYFKKGPIPCVFCDVRKSSYLYSLPTRNITGIFTDPPLEETIKILSTYYPNSRSLVIISLDSASDQADRLKLDSLCSKSGILTTHAIVNTFAAWKTRFSQANESADIIYLTSAQSITDWDENQAKEFVTEHIKVPVFTCDVTMMPFAVFGIAPDLNEQGQWAAEATLKILHWKRPKDIPIATGSKTQAYLNESLAKKISFEPDEALKQRCKLASQINQTIGETQ